jgi:general secretion pathway protein H
VKLSSRRTIHRGSGGFTLIELIVVLVLVALASSLVYLGVARSLGGHEEKVFGRELVSLTKRARRMAIEHGVASALLISSEERRCWVRGETGAVEVPETMLIEGEDVAQVEEGVYGIAFYPDGSSSGGTLSFSVGGQVVYAFRTDPITGIISVSKKES